MAYQKMSSGGGEANILKIFRPYILTTAGSDYSTVAQVDVRNYNKLVINAHGDPYYNPAYYIGNGWVDFTPFVDTVINLAGVSYIQFALKNYATAYGTTFAIDKFELS